MASPSSSPQPRAGLELITLAPADSSDLEDEGDDFFENGLASPTILLSNGTEEQPAALRRSVSVSSSASAASGTALWRQPPTPVVAAEQWSCRRGAKRAAGLLMMAASAAVFSILGLFANIAAPRFSSFEIVSIRFYGQLLVTALVMLVLRISPRVQGPRIKYVVSRGVTGTMAMTFFYFGVSHMPLGAANVIFFTNPALTLVLAFLVLRESCTWLDVMALVLSLAGVVCVIRPAVLFGASGAAEAEAEAQRHSNTADGFKVSIVLAGMLCLVASALAAGTFVVIRKLQDVSKVVITFYFSVIGCIVSTTLTLWNGGFAWPHTLGDVAIFLSMGGLGFTGQMLMTGGLQLEKAGPASMMRQLDVVFAFVYQAVLEKEPISGWSLVGAALVMSCAFMVAAKKCVTANPATTSAAGPKAQPGVAASTLLTSTKLGLQSTAYSRLDVIDLEEVGMADSDGARSPEVMLNGDAASTSASQE